ncbi:MAG: Rne/Rng family ribonuclease [Alphaproteobacteria bacterium]
MSKRILIDAAHLEETRVVVLSGNRVEEFDHESTTRKPLKGNIYLAKVTRVEPSLQAAFVDYGGNRHGFLAFGEVHPDYYRIPVEDRQALLAEESHSEDESEAANGGEAGAPSQPAGEGHVETLGGDAGEDVQRRRARFQRRYKIQEVIKRRQILLVQVTKEERGTKGAALTTYLSLAGRYCVLMPNTGRGGGISRKITSQADRRRLKAIVDDLQMPEGMSLILRTAGQQRTKAEVKRDFEYLVRLWDEIREQTLKSTAPALIHEEADVTKRAIRDLYGRDVDEVIVDGEEGYKSARAIMKALMPSHTKRVQLYSDTSVPLFHRFGVENQLDTIFSPVVQLRSGGSIVINATEALVAIDVNSGRATKERNIEETATKTNLEAAEEIARQLRLRDLAGLIVIDFIDMEDSRNISAVERRLKDAMKDDRARIQIGRISHFGLLEMSRQRLRPSLVETSTEQCPLCGGSGRSRSAESTALQILRSLEEEGLKQRASEITVTLPTRVAIHLLNQKRRVVGEIEDRYNFRIIVVGDDHLMPPNFRIEHTRPREAGQLPAPAVQPAVRAPEIEEVETEAEESEAAAETHAPEGEAQEPSGEGRRRGRRRRGRRGGRHGDHHPPRDHAPQDEVSRAAPLDAEGMEAGEEAEEAGEAPAFEGPGEAQPGQDEGRRRRRRGRRGGRRRRRRDDSHAPEASGSDRVQGGDGTGEEGPLDDAGPESAPSWAAPEESQPSESYDRGREPESHEASHERPTEHHVERHYAPEPREAPAEPEPARGASDEAANGGEPAPAEPPREEPQGPPRRGWWNRLTR